jgi:hypothetical protein
VALVSRLTAPPPRRHEKPMIEAMARAHTLGVAETIGHAQLEMRDDVLAAGLGFRLANTIRKDVFPDGRFSLNAAGTVYAAPGRRGGRTAPAILGFYESGRPITPLGGALALPTREVPITARGRRQMTPAEVEATFGRKLQRVRLKSGNIGLFMRLRRGKGFKSVLMFTLVRGVPGRKVLDLAGIFRRRAARLGAAIAANFEVRG